MVHAMVSLEGAILGCSHSLTDLALQVQEEDSRSHLERCRWMLMLSAMREQWGATARGARAVGALARKGGRLLVRATVCKTIMRAGGLLRERFLDDGSVWCKSTIYRQEG